MKQLETDADVSRLLRRHGIEPAVPLDVEELSGGISCRVLRVRTEDSDVVVKQALPRLRVAEVWQADVTRAGTEARFGVVMTELVPGASPRVLATDADAHAFVMAAAPAGSAPWKEALLAGVVDVDIARRVGDLLGRLHARAAERSDLAEEFADTSNFRTLRLEPYLAVTAAAHPDLADRIAEVSAILADGGRALVHGDVSPKNLLVTPAGDVLLIDHEVAHWGQPEFDTAFVVNHLCLKAFVRPAHAGEYHRAARTLLEAYTAVAGSAGATPQRTAVVLAPLLLARIDGRSPVEYLDEGQRRTVRHLARRLVAERPGLDELLERVFAEARR